MDGLWFCWMFSNGVTAVSSLRQAKKFRDGLKKRYPTAPRLRHPGRVGLLANARMSSARQGSSAELFKRALFEQTDADKLVGQLYLRSRNHGLL